MAVGKDCHGVRTSSASGHLDVMCWVTALSSAACEWFLILLLFIHGLLSYFLREFARYCKLPTPCLACSRFDHYVSNKVPESYQSMICIKHGLEIFSDVVCNDCLFSCAVRGNSTTESIDLLMNKVSKTLSQPNKCINGSSEHSAVGSVRREACACCGKIWSSKQIQRGTIQNSSPVREIFKPSIPLRNVPSRTKLNYMRRKREKSYGSLYSNHLWNDMRDPYANKVFRAIKDTSYSETDAPFSDGADGIIMLLETKTIREDNELQITSRRLADAQSNILAQLKSGSKICFPANLGVDEGVKEMNVSGVVQNSSPPALPELLYLDDNPNTCNPSNNDSPCESTGKDETSLAPTSTPVMQLEITCLADPCPSTKQIELPVKDSATKSSINGASNEVIEHVDSSATTFTSVDEMFDDDAPSVANNHVDALNTTFTCLADKSDDDIPSVANEYVDTLSSTFTSVDSKFYDDTTSVANEHATSYGSPSLSDSAEGLKTSLVVKDKTTEFHDGLEEESNLSSRNEESVHGTELRSFSSILRKQDNSKNLNFYITRVSAESMTPREADSSERNESAFESTAGSVVSDREGESLVDRLKRQIEYDRERVASLYKELDEERSASAIAANQTMAMITRLQEEKAAVSMEALHYLRMMEEQAEYDVEALEKANDLLSDKEKDIQDLEAELEQYRGKATNGFSEKQKSEMIHNSKDTFSSYMGSDGELKNEENPKYYNLPEIEEQKLHISECLKRLEQKLHTFKGLGSTALTPNGVNSEMTEDGDGSQPGDCYEDNGHYTQNELQVSDRSFETAQVKEPVSFKSETSNKHYGSEKMEANHVCDVLLESHQMGNEGLLIIEEIAHQLQELWKLVLKDHYIVP